MARAKEKHLAGKGKRRVEFVIDDPVYDKIRAIAIKNLIASGSSQLDIGIVFRAILEDYFKKKR